MFLTQINKIACQILLEKDLKFQRVRTIVISLASSRVGGDDDDPGAQIPATRHQLTCTVMGGGSYGVGGGVSSG